MTELDKTGMISVAPLQQQTGEARFTKGKKGKQQRLCPSALPGAILAQLRNLDEQTAVNRYVWYNLPDGITGQMIERMLYYRSVLGFFWMDDDESGDEWGTFRVLPQSPTAGTDIYGRWNKTTPLPFGSANESEDKPWVDGLEYDVLKKMPIDFTEENLKKVVILQDYTPQANTMKSIPRWALNDQLLRYMSEIFPMSRTKLLNSTGVTGVRVQSDADSSSVFEAAKTVETAALNGLSYVPIQSSLKLEDLGKDKDGNVSDFLLTMQTLDNYRLSLYGLKQGGIYDKSQYVNDTQAAVQQANIGLIYQDGLTIRQNFCDWVNANFGPILLKKTGRFIWCGPSETVVAQDIDGNGIIEDTTDTQRNMEVQDEQANV